MGNYRHIDNGLIFPETNSVKVEESFRTLGTLSLTTCPRLLWLLGLLYFWTLGYEIDGMFARETFNIGNAGAKGG